MDTSIKRGDKVTLHKEREKDKYLVLSPIKTKSGAVGWWMFHPHGYYVAVKTERIKKVVQRAGTE